MSLILFNWHIFSMNQLWQDFLQYQNAVIGNGSVAHFSDPAAELEHTQSGTIIVDLSQWGIIRFSGEDAQTFLQGQLTCDVNHVNDQLAQIGSYCTPKGRMLASFHLWKEDDDYLMQLPVELCASIQKRLSMFVMRAKVKLTDESDLLIRIGLAGSGSTALIEALKDDMSDSVVSYAADRYELITTPEKAPVIWAQLIEHAKPVGAACWDWLTIRSGVPVVLSATQDQFIPQMVNLDRIEGVSFQKGCYPGQEIVARTHYLGKIKRRMYLANISTTEMVVAGDELFSADMVEQSCGKIVNAAPSPNGGVDVLAVIQVSSVEAGYIFCRQVGGPVLEIIQLPYTLVSVI